MFGCFRRIFRVTPTQYRSGKTGANLMKSPRMIDVAIKALADILNWLPTPPSDEGDWDDNQDPFSKLDLELVSKAHVILSRIPEHYSNQVSADVYALTNAAALLSGIADTRIADAYVKIMTARIVLERFAFIPADLVAKIEELFSRDGINDIDGSPALKRVHCEFVSVTTMFGKTTYSATQEDVFNAEPGDVIVTTDQGTAVFSLRPTKYTQIYEWECILIRFTSSCSHDGYTPIRLATRASS